MKKPIIALTNFDVVMPKIIMRQSEILDYTAQAHSKNLVDGTSTHEKIETLFRRYGIKDTEISQRGFDHIDMGARKADIQERTAFYSERANEVLTQFYPYRDQPPHHLVHVTCTGYVSPSAAQTLVNRNDWFKQTRVTHAYHMGCYAALPAIRMAEGFVSALVQTTQENIRSVDIVHTEMCGLHINALDHSPEQIVVQSLFADGHIKYSAVTAPTATVGFSVINISEQIIKDSQADMSWQPAPWGMSMTLSREVPRKIAATVRDFLIRLAEESDVSFRELLKSAHFAIHPGGPKIIDSVQEALELSNEQIQTSRDILFARGNMSSATLPHVWEKMLSDGLESGTKVVSLAFGPGLTMFGAVFEVI